MRVRWPVLSRTVSSRCSRSTWISQGTTWMEACTQWDPSTTILTITEGVPFPASLESSPLRSVFTISLEDSQPRRTQSRSLRSGSHPFTPTSSPIFTLRLRESRQTFKGSGLVAINVLLPQQSTAMSTVSPTCRVSRALTARRCSQGPALTSLDGFAVAMAVYTQALGRAHC